MNLLPPALRRSLVGLAIASLFLVVALRAQTGTRETAALPNFDRRTIPPAAVAPTAAADSALGASVRGVRIDRDALLGTPAFVNSTEGFLTGPTGSESAAALTALSRLPADDPHRRVKAFIDEQAALFGHGSAVLSAARISRDYVTAHNNLRTTIWEQHVEDIRVFEATFQAHATGRGELVNVASRLLPNLAAVAQNSSSSRASLLAAPPISARAAIALAAQNIGEQLAESSVEPQGAPEDAEARQSFTAPSLTDAVVRYVWLPMDVGTIRLCWEVVCTVRTKSRMFRLLVDAANGEVLVRRNLTDDIGPASYRVFTSDSPSPLSPGTATNTGFQPPTVSRTLVTLSALNTTASPNGWIDDGVTETRGNNVDAHTDLNNDNLPDLPRPQSTGAGRVFDFALDLTLAPSTYRDAAVVDLFYWCNWMHDKLYELGFTEAAGNFQNNNFGRGGAGNDAVQADAQDGSGTNNANFSTPADGSPGRMQMYVFTAPNPDRDGDFDHEVVLHEYTHGLSNRLVGGGVGMSALVSRGMGEGWSDFYALALLSESTDDVNGNYAAGAYVTQNYYNAIRRYPYTTDITKNPLTFKDIDPAQTTAPGTANEVHNMGEVWCVALWEARAKLIAKLGFATGNQLILQLVTDGMKLAPANPNFLQARDAILTAEQVATGGANRPELLSAFAKRGMGASATAPASTTTTGLVQNFDPVDTLAVSPTLPAAASGVPGGPFTPNTATYVLTNTSGAALSWTAAKTAAWLDLSSAGGTLAAGATVNVTASLNAAANTLVPATYSSTLIFTNVTSGNNLTRTFGLAVVPPRISLFALDADPGWTRNGEWAFGHPTGGGGGANIPNHDPSNGATGSNVFGINLSGNYVTTVGSAAYLTAGPFNFTGYAYLQLQFQRWLNCDWSGYVNSTVEVSNNGTTWTQISINPNSATTDEGAWNKVTYDISPVADNQPTVYIRWGHQVVSSSSVYVGAGWNIDDVELLGQPTASFFSWQQGKFTAGELAAPALSGPGAVFGLDGLPNLVKYALGLEPKTNITSGLPDTTTLGSDWVFTYTRPASVTDVTYAVEVSTNLATWTTAGVTHEFVSTAAGVETWRGRYPLASATNAFFRLRVVQP